VDWTPEQEQILRHGSGHGRIQAGPGTGKSTTVIELAARLAAGRPEGSVRLATFTRAATKELANKALAEEVPIPVTTVHSLALSLLVRNSQWSRLPLPIRIPDQWETNELLHEDLRFRLSRDRKGLRKSAVARLEREMAAQWESLDETRLVADMDPDLRNDYIAAWRRQRTVFGFSLFAEMPWYALELVDDHPEADLLGAEFLVVDEYQDLNRCEIRLLRALSGCGIAVMSVGDEDQSIYSWRMAAPEGIRQFQSEFAGSADYTLSVSQRCARRILDAAQRVIGVAPGRDQARPPTQPAEHNPDGVFEYLRFPSGQAERKAAVKLLGHHREHDDVPFERMAILVRSDYQSRWSKPLREELELAEIPYTDVEAALEPLHTDAARELLAVARLALNPEDDLAWWTLLKVRPGVADSFTRAVADLAWSNDRRFHQQLELLESDEVPGATQASRRRAIDRIARVKAVLEELNPTNWQSDEPWVTWLRRIADRLDIVIADDLDVLLVRAEPAITEEGGIRELLAQLEPIARDLAMEEPAVSIMNVARSKGLTFDVVVTLGVEGELFPLPMSDDPEEERRLLYVAMTRARLCSYLTMARFRNDGTAHSGSGDAIASRSRCEYLSQAGIRPTDGPSFMSTL